MGRRRRSRASRVSRARRWHAAYRSRSRRAACRSTRHAGRARVSSTHKIDVTALGFPRRSARWQVRASEGIVITADVSLKLLLGGDSSARVYRDPNLRAMQAEWASQPLHSVMIIVITT